MANEQLPVTPPVLRWARERAGFSLDEATDLFAKFEDWENGESAPTFPQLEKLAEQFKIPVAVFFFPEPPNLPPINESFRTLPAETFEQIPRQVKALLRKAQALQLNLSELCGGKNPAERNILRGFEFDVGVAVEEMARSVRDYMAISIDEQTAWNNDDIALKAWRSRLINVGIFVFKDAFRVGGYSGFCLYDETFPIIYLNNSSTKTRQIFSLFHELAHLFFQTSGIDSISDDFVPGLPVENRRIEILCNRFAAEFLLPTDVFEDSFAGMSPTEETAEILAAQYKVSREFIFRRFLDRGLVGEDEYTAVAERWAGQMGRGGPGGNFYWTKISHLGREYIQLALSQYHQNRISDEELAEYLDAKPRHVDTLEEYFSRGEA